MDYKRLMNECPAVIGMLTSTLQSGGSIDTAIRTITTNGPILSREIFTDVVRKADTKGSPSLSRCLSDRMSELPAEATGYSRAILMALSAAESTDNETKDRMLRDSADISLESVREMGESYGASLTTPCMTIFGIGIMVPMILMSILPMLSIGGMFSSKTIDQNIIVAVTIVVIPCAILLMSIRLRNRNPFLTRNTSIGQIRYALPILLAIPMAAAYSLVTDDMEGLFVFSLAPACIAAVILMSDVIRNDRARRACEQSLMDSVFDIGNRMLSGTNFENAAAEAMSARKGSTELSETFRRECVLCRGDVYSAIYRSVDPVSTEMSLALRNICLCSENDSDDAGRLAVTLGKQFQNRNITRKSLEHRLKSTTDMMSGTAMVFAPLVLGMSVSMLGPLSKLSGYVAMEGTSLVLGVYLIELSALISILISSLGDGDDISKMIWRFCIMCPISLIVFAISCALSL
jgi:hypothetical protein